MKYLYTYPNKCTGCKLCAIACSLKKFGECNPKRSAISILRNEFERYEIQFVCLQCREPRCAVVCPVQALRIEGNIIKLDKPKCIGCRLCVITCPFGGILSNNGEIIKCDLCNGEPICVKFCSTQAIVYTEEIKEITDKRKQLAKILLPQG